MGNTKKIFILAIAMGIIAVAVLLAVFVFSGEELSEKDKLFYELLGTNDVNVSLKFLIMENMIKDDFSKMENKISYVPFTGLEVVNLTNQDICFDEDINTQVFIFDELNNIWIEKNNLVIKTEYVFHSSSKETLETIHTLIPWDQTTTGDTFWVNFKVPSPSSFDLFSSQGEGTINELSSDVIVPSSYIRVSVSGVFCGSEKPVAAYIDIEYTP